MDKYGLIHQDRNHYDFNQTTTELVVHSVFVLLRNALCTGTGDGMVQSTGKQY